MITLLSQAAERWSARAIWVMSRADANYPRRFKTRLKEDAPPLLYGCGDAALLEMGGLAVVGSRHMEDELIQAIKEAAASAAAELKQETLPFALREQAAPALSLNSAETAALTPVPAPLPAKTEKPATAVDEPQRAQRTQR